VERALLHPRHWPAWVGFGLIRIASFLPTPTLFRFGRLLGRLALPLARSRARIARRNLELCFPEMDDPQRQQLLRAHFESLGISMLETPLAWWGSDRRVDSLGSISGIEHLEDAVAEGRGVLLLSAHFTSLEISGRFLLKYAEFDAMYRPSNNPVVEYLMARARARHSGGLIARDDVKKLIRRLRAGHVVWYAPDQNTKRTKGVFVRFFGHQASTTPATHRLARMTGARVVPFKAVRKTDDSGYQLTLEPALDAFPTEDVEADTQRVNDIIERWVREHPDQYLWIHRRFRTRPNRSDPRIY